MPRPDHTDVKMSRRDIQTVVIALNQFVKNNDIDKQTDEDIYRLNKRLFRAMDRA